MATRGGRLQRPRAAGQDSARPVRALTRVRMGSVTLGRLRPGEWRELTPAEVKALKGNR